MMDESSFDLVTYLTVADETDIFPPEKEPPSKEQKTNVVVYDAEEEDPLWPFGM